MDSEIILDALDSNLTILTTNLCFSDIMQDLIVNKILGFQEATTINEIRGDPGKIMAFLKVLRMTDLRITWPKFVEILRKHDKYQIVEPLEKKLKTCNTSLTKRHISSLPGIGEENSVCCSRMSSRRSTLTPLTSTNNSETVYDIVSVPHRQLLLPSPG